MLTFFRLIEEISDTQDEAGNVTEMFWWLNDSFRSKIINLILKFSIQEIYTNTHLKETFKDVRTDDIGSGDKMLIIL